MSQKKLETIVFDPEWSRMRALMHIFFWAIIGTLCIGFGGILIYSIFAYSPESPSFLTESTFQTPTNDIFLFLNDIGAFGSEFLGGVSFILAVSLIAFGFQSFRMKHRVSYKKTKILALMFGLLISGFLLGGVANYMYDGTLQANMISGFWGMLFFQNLYQPYLSPLDIWWQAGIYFILALVGILSLIFALNIPLKISKKLVFGTLAAIKNFSFKGFEKLQDINIMPVFSNPFRKNVIEEEDRYIEEPEEEIEVASKKKRAPRKRKALPPKADGEPFILPSVDFLMKAKQTGSIKLSPTALKENAQVLAEVLKDFGVKGEIQHVRPGPVVTLYELLPAPGTKSSRIVGLADDIARSLSAVSVRIAVVKGSNTIGIELPNQKREIVYMREMLESKHYKQTDMKLPLILGKDIGGEPQIADLAKMPHLLVAGTTGSGKSVAINTMILSLIYHLPPEKCKFIMVDPKMLELSVYDDIPHLLTPVVTEPRKAVVALKWAVKEMEDRYRAMSKVGVRNIEGYNERMCKANEKGEVIANRIQTGFDAEGKPIFEEQPLDMEELPYIVVIVDEMADLMLVAGKDIEAAIQRLAQMARAAGIHLIMATQRPSVDVITGTIKANFPTRISFQVTSKIDSRTILGEQGAEQLLGQGDMLYMPGGGGITRVHGPFVKDDEVGDVVGYLKTQGSPAYMEEVTRDEEDGMSDPQASLFGGASGGERSKEDQQYDEAVALVCRERKASTSFVQRHLRIGYNTAARLIERMEKEGVISEANHAGKREILVPEKDY